MKIPIDRILVDNNNNVSRNKIDRESCQELADSIRDNGLITSVTVREIEHPEFDYQLMVGYRRMFAMAHMLGLTDVEAWVREDVDEHQAKVINMLENMHRLDPDYWDWCCALRDTFEPDTGDTAIARAINKSRSWVRNRWLVWKMPPDVIAQVEAGLLSASQVSLLIHKSYEEQQAAAVRIRRGVEEGETTQQMEASLSNRRSVKPKKQVQAMMTQLMADGYEKEMHTLRWAIGEITDTQLMGFIK